MRIGYGKDAWWNEIVKSKNKLTKRVFFMFCSMFSLFQRKKNVKTMQTLLHKEVI